MHFWQTTYSIYMEKYFTSQSFEQRNPISLSSPITESARNLEKSMDHSMTQFIFITGEQKHLSASLPLQRRWGGAMKEKQKN